jgi:Domain of unknown function (DUF4340)
MTYGPNKMRGRTAAILVAGALVSTLLAAGSFWVQRTMSGEKQVSGKVLPDFTADMPQVRTIAMTTQQGSYNLVRAGTNWVMPERDNYPVAPAALAQLAKGLADLSYKSARTSDPSQFARLGVDDPGTDSDGVLVSLKGASNQLLNSLYIGTKAEAIFVRKAGSNDVFEADGKLPSLANLAFWLDLKVLDVTAETIASVSGQHAGEARYDIVRRPDGGFAPVGGQANVTATTAAIALTKWAPLDVMAASALSRDPIASHATTLRSGVMINIAAYQENDRNWVVVSAASNGEEPNEAASKLNQRTDGWAFELNATDFADFTFARTAVMSGPIEEPPN